LPIKAEVKQETSEVMKSVDEDRKYVIQATIVRIMKARKTMKNQPLIQEVIAQISQRFSPKIPDIKKAIDTLLEKEYIERVEGTRDTFNYVVRPRFALLSFLGIDAHDRHKSWSCAYFRLPLASPACMYIGHCPTFLTLLMLRCSITHEANSISYSYSNILVE
jgi:hypothetical protein